MADYQTIMGALRKADAAGDVAGAKRLAAMAREAQSTSQNPIEDKSYTSTILPFSKDREGRVSFDSSAGLLGGILGGLKSAATLPHDVMTGEVDPMSDEGLGRVLETATMASPMSALARSGMKSTGSAISALKRQSVNSPSAQALKAEARTGYDQVRDMGVDYSSDHVVSMAQKIQQNLEAEGFSPELSPKTFSVIKKLQDAPPDSVAPLSGLEAARRSFGKASKDFNNPSDQEASRIAREALEKFVMDPDPASVVAGPASAAGKALKDARGDYAAYKRSGDVTGIQDAADLRAAAANSGQNTGNSTRGRVASMLLSDKKKAGFSREELAALEGVVEGSGAANATRRVGNLLGGGGGLGQLLAGGAGAVAGGAVGAPGLGAAGALSLGMGSKALSNKLTRKALSEADELVRKRSPLYERMAKDAPFASPNIPHSRDALIRALLLQQQGN